jgi:hypothetical protein
VQGPHRSAAMIEEGNQKCRTAIQAVGCTGYSGVIGPNRHLDTVEDLLITGPVTNQLSAARRTLRFIGATLCVVPTIRLARVMHPFSSVV